jgi:hypothetical protein
MHSTQHNNNTIATIKSNIQINQIKEPINLHMPLHVSIKQSINKPSNSMNHRNQTQSINQSINQSMRTDNGIKQPNAVYCLSVCVNVKP